jgi:tRNA pseudouridine38-40 synthase
MNEAGQLLFKHTDFQCFSKVNTDVNTFDCTIFEAYWKRDNGNLILPFANRFCAIWCVHCGNTCKCWITQNHIGRFFAIIESKTEIKQVFRYRHMVYI